MLSYSSSALAAIDKGAKQYFSATFLFLDGTTLNVGGSDIVSNSITYSGGVSQQGQLDIGGCVIKSLKFTLNNYSGKFDNINWTGLRVTPFFEVEISAGQEEGATPDVFYMVSHKRNGKYIVCEAYDGLKLLDEGEDQVNKNGETAFTVIRRMLVKHGLSLESTTFSGYDTVLTPTDKMSDRQLLAYICQRIGTFAVMRNGKLRIGRYSNSVTRTLSTTFSAEFDAVSLGYTGVRYTKEDGTAIVTGDVTSSTAYVYELKPGDNPLITDATAQNAISKIWTFLQMINSQTPCKVEVLTDPSIEAGDRVYVTDPETQQRMLVPVSNFTYKPGSVKETISFDAEDRGKTDIRQVNLNHAIYEAEKGIGEQIDAYTAAYRMFENLMSQSMGLFFTEEPQEGGGVKLYMHNKQNLADSTTIWKLADNSFTVSNDGGKSFTAGISADGDIIAQALYGKFISADIIEGGLLKDLKNNNYWNLKTGVIQLKNGLIRDANNRNKWDLDTGNLDIYGTLHTNYYGTSTGAWLQFQNAEITGGLNENGAVDIVPKTTLKLASKMSGYEYNGTSYSGAYGTYMVADNFRQELKRLELVDSNKNYIFRINLDDKEARLSANLNMGNYYIMNPQFKFGNYGDLSPDTGVTGDFNFVAIHEIDSSGTPKTWTPGASLTFKNGICIGAVM